MDNQESKTIKEPHELRKLCREQKFTGQTSGQCPGYVQANIVILPAAYAKDFEQFCTDNPKPCPLLEVCKEGKKEVPQFCPKGADICTDVPKYKVFRHGKFEKEVHDIIDLWQEDFVTLVLGCSFSFEESLIKNDLPIRHIDEGKNVPMFKTSIPCQGVGIFQGSMVVTMRPFKKHQIQQVIDTTAQFPKVHGAPIYYGLEYNKELGIEDLTKPDYGDAVTIQDDDIPVFWGCGVTPQNVLLQATDIPIVITHAPGCMLVTDVLNEDVKH